MPPRRSYEAMFSLTGEQLNRLLDGYDDAIANLSAFWSWLEQYGLVEMNPWRNMKRGEGVHT